MTSGIEMTHKDYVACHETYRRVVRGQKELLVLDKTTGKRTWIPVRIVQHEEVKTHANA